MGRPHFTALGMNSPELPELRRCALDLLAQISPHIKADAVRALGAAWAANRLHGAHLVLDPHAKLLAEAPIPGRPALPELVAPKLVEHRSMVTVEGRAAMIHALAHIEFNAINLALDVIWRFPELPAEFYTDWLQVAVEEALHFSLLSAHLQTLGFAYGDFKAHNSLWEMAEKTQVDVLARIGLVPRTLEARGLDTAPPMRAKLAQAGDLAAAAILDIILRDEIGHVAIGNRWYGWLCKQRGLDPVLHYAELATRYKAPQLRGPFNMAARRAAGFTEQELAAL